MRPNIWKILISFPYYLKSLRKSAKWFNRMIKDPNSVSEDRRYKWVQKKAKYIMWLHNIKVKVIGYENWLDGSVVLAPNHQSNMDGAVIFSLNDFSKTAPCAFVAKAELQDSKKLNRFLSLIDVVFIERDNLRQTINALKEANDLIKVPRSMVIFPEGTRNPDSKNLLEFKDGAFKIPQKAYVPIVPVTISGSHEAFTGSRTKKKNIYVIFHKPIMPEKFIHNKTKDLSNVVKRIIQDGLDKIEKVKSKMTTVKQAIKQLEKSQNKKDRLENDKLRLFPKKK